jgi:hypothetical protein
MSEGGKNAAGTESESRRWGDNLIRLALVVSGVALLVNGVVVAYVADEGASAAALMAAGAAFLFIAYLRPYGPASNIRTLRWNFLIYNEHLFRK